jgi:hypothetical protein
MQTHFKTCKVLAYEKFSRGDAVVEWDDLPTRFFAILDGRTGVYIPRKAQAAAEAALVEKINAWNTKRKANEEKPLRKAAEICKEENGFTPEEILCSKQFSTVKNNIIEYTEEFLGKFMGGIMPDE